MMRGGKPTSNIVRGTSNFGGKKDNRNTYRGSAVKELQQQPPVQHARNGVRVVYKEAVKDTRYWEEKVVDAMCRITQRLAA